MRYNVILEVGDKLRQSDIETISTNNLMNLLQKSTRVLGVEERRKYMTVLRDEGYIRFNRGVWEIIRPEKKEVNVNFNVDQLIKTEEELDKKIEEIKKAKPINPMDEHSRTEQISEQKRKQQRYALAEKLQAEARGKKGAMHKGDLYVLWVDPYEYHCICKECYDARPELHNLRGKTPIEDILAYNPKICEYCGREFACPI